MRYLWVTVLLAAVALNASANSAKSNDLQRQLNAEFKGKSFPTKILLGSYVVTTENGQECYKMVDTELSPDGSIQYQTRKGCFTPSGWVIGSELFSKNYYLDASRLTARVLAGTQVWVRKVECKDNRIEFDLSTSAQTNDINGYARIKFMLGQAVAFA